MAFDPVRRQRLETPPPHPEFPPRET